MVDAKSMNLNELSAATRENLKALGYGKRTICMINSIWRDLARFLGNKSELPFLPIYGLEYLHERIGYPECLQRKLAPDERDYIRAVRMLTTFQESGEIPEALRRNRSKWYEPVKDIRNRYIQHCEEIYKTHATRRSRIAAADRFMRIVVVNRQTAWEDISAKTISEYAMGLAEYAKATVEVHLRGLRYFLQFLYDTGIVKQDHTESVPKMYCSTGERIPHMLSTEQVNELLKSIDRGNPIGKRNYAILVMAACLGMRDSDITNLKFENINWEKYDFILSEENPYIFTNKELSRFLDCAKHMSGSIQRKTVFYMLFSLLICTGLRLGEALRLRWADIDWDNTPMMLSVIGAKFDKDRAIPVADGLSQRLCKYREEMSLLFPGCEYLFPSRHYAPYSETQVYITFRKTLWNAGISHGGSGKGPRIHDFRNSFAVKSLRKMVYNKEDIMAVMPLLSQYLGHKNIYATQNYLQFTADMFPYVTKTVQTALGNVIPGTEEYDEETY